jgi:imidazolonepropionase-like amidohydrolase
MKNRRGLLVFIFLLPSLVAQPIGKQGTLVLNHVTVIDATGVPARRNTTVVIVGDRIAQIGKSWQVSLPENARVIDAAGKYLIPGLGHARASV